MGFFQKLGGIIPDIGEEQQHAVDRYMENGFEVVRRGEQRSSRTDQPVAGGSGISLSRSGTSGSKDQPTVGGQHQSGVGGSSSNLIRGGTSCSNDQPALGRASSVSKHPPGVGGSGEVNSASGSGLIIQIWQYLPQKLMIKVRTWGTIMFRMNRVRGVRARPVLGRMTKGLGRQYSGSLCYQSSILSPP